MKITKIEDGPKCDDCFVLLKVEGSTFTEKQIAAGGPAPGEFKGIRYIRIPMASLMRCPKCFALYRIED